VQAGSWILKRGIWGKKRRLLSVLPYQSFYHLLSILAGLASLRGEFAGTASLAVMRNDAERRSKVEEETDLKGNNI
jgi:hypothetical protein